MLNTETQHIAVIPHIADRDHSAMERVAVRLATLKAVIDEAIAELQFDDGMPRDFAVAHLDDLILMVGQFVDDERAEHPL